MKLELKKTLAHSAVLVDFLAAETALSKSQIKKALNFGGGWLTRSGQKTPRRCRRAQTKLMPGDTVAFYFDDNLINYSPPPAALLQSNRHWSIWYKPANVPAQGTPFGDRGCMLDQVAQAGGITPFLVHRLDREAAGLMLFAHHKDAAAALSNVWQQRRVEKIYQAEVVGVPSPAQGEITLPLDGKEARTCYRLHSSSGDTALVSVQIETGRLHQIRRHLAMVGHPLVGDPRYAGSLYQERLSPEKTGLRLVATGLHFECPLTQAGVNCELPPQWKFF